VSTRQNIPGFGFSGLGSSFSLLCLSFSLLGIGFSRLGIGLSGFSSFETRLGLCCFRFGFLEGCLDFIETTLSFFDFLSVVTLLVWFDKRRDE